MVRLTRIYTRGGDSGRDLARRRHARPKHAAGRRLWRRGRGQCGDRDRPAARRADADEMLGRIQNDLFDLGADLCPPEDGRRAAGALRIAAPQVERLEREIDAMNASCRRSIVHPARRHAGRGLPAPRPHDRPAGRAPGRRARRRRAGQPRGAPIPEPPVGPPLRARPPGQRQRRPRRAVAPRRQPLTPRQLSRSPAGPPASRP